MDRPRPAEVSESTSPALGPRLRCMEIRGGNRAAREPFQTPGLDGWVFSRPHERARQGGDLHYISLCGGGLITRLVVADVSGHGARVAEFSGQLRTLMRKHINTKDQSRLLGDLNRDFALLSPPERFATAIVATFLASSRALTLCNAGHPRPLLYRKGTNAWTFLESEIDRQGDLPLGVDEESAYGQFRLVLAPGDVLILYTDALTEAASPGRELLGESGLLGLAGQCDPSDAAALGAELLRRVEQHRGDQPADDDLTLLCLVSNGEGPRRLGLAEKIEVFAKFFGLRDY